MNEARSAEIVQVRAIAVDSLAEEIGRTCQDKGFREEWDMAGDLEAFAEEMYGFDEITSERRDWFYEVANTLRNCVVAAKIALICSEACEALESLRTTGVGRVREEGNFGEELADAQIRLLELGDLLGLSNGDEIVAKMEVNSGRPHRHGRRF
jgi:hypothetical protein